MTGVYVVGIGTCSPLGLDLPSLQAEVAVGGSRIREIGASGDTGCILDVLDDAATRTERMCFLGATALRELLQRRSDFDFGQALVSIALPETQRGGDFDLRTVRSSLESVFGQTPMSWATPWCVQRGRAGFMLALESAVQALVANRCSAALVGGIDSWCDPGSLRWLNEHRRMLNKNTPDGLIPGEGAGFVLLTRCRQMAKLPGVIEIAAVATAQEPAPLESTGQNLSAGLSTVFRRLSQTVPTRADHILSCQTGESYWGKEFMAAYLRNPGLMSDPISLDQLAEDLSETGAASGVLAMALAQAQLGKLGERKPAQVLLYGSSDTGAVGGCVVAGTKVQSAVDIRLGEVMNGLHLPDLAPLPIIANFKRQFHVDHLEALGFLLDQRTLLLGHDAKSWPDVESTDLQIMAHHQALAVDGGAVGTLALEFLSEAEDMDEDILLGALFMLCSWATSKECHQAFFRWLETAPEELLAIARIAMRMGMQPRLGLEFEALLGHERPELVVLAAEVIGLRKEPCITVLRPLLAATNPAIADALAFAIAGLNAREWLPVLIQQLPHHPASAPLLLALVQLGDRAGLQSARNQLHHTCDDVALYEVLAVAGDLYDARLIERCMRRDGMSEQALLALGGLGYVESLPILTQALALENEGIATAAARALLRMTGAPMWQLMEVEDEDSDAVEMEVPVTSPAEWQAWLATKADLFRAGRYRAGAKFSLESCWAELREPSSRGYERRIAALELVVRGGSAIDLEVDGWVVQQKHALTKLQVAGKKGSHN